MRLCLLAADQFVYCWHLLQEEGWGGSLDAHLRIQALLAVIFIPFCPHRTGCLHGGGYFTYAGEDKGSEATICVVVRKPLSVLRADLPVWLL